MALLIALAGGALTLNHQLVGVFYDDGLYAGIAYALSHGLGYVHPFLPGHPEVVQYPPLYPLVLAPFFGLLPVQAAGFAAKLLDVIFAAAGAGLIAWHASRTELLGPPPEVPRWLAPAIVAAAAIALPMLTILSVLFSEPLFGLLLAVAVILADRPPARWSPDRAALLAGVAAALALLTRSIGIAAGFGIVAYAVLVRRSPWRQTVLSGAPVGVAALGWLAWVARHHGGIDPGMGTHYGSYFETLRGAGLAVFWPSLRQLPRPLGDLTLSWLPSSGLYYGFAAAALLILLYGLALLARRSSVGFSLLGYLAILAIWPFAVDRFIWAVLPWLGLAWAAAALDLWRRPSLRPLRLPVALCAGVIALGYGQLELRGLVTGSWRAAPTLVSTLAGEMLPWLRTLPRDAVIAADFEPLFSLQTGLTCVPLYVYGYHGREIVTPPPAGLRAYLERQGVTHVLISGYVSRSAPQLDALVKAYPGWLTMAKGWYGGRAVFQVNRGR